MGELEGYFDSSVYSVEFTREELFALSEYLKSRGCNAKDFHSAEKKIDEVLINSQK